MLGGYILLYPRARILTVVLLIFFFTLVELPAWAMLGLWLIFDALLGALASRPRSAAAPASPTTRTSAASRSARSRDWHAGAARA